MSIPIDLPVNIFMQLGELSERTGEKKRRTATEMLELKCEFEKTKLTVHGFSVRRATKYANACYEPIFLNYINSFFKSNSSIKVELI
jgi:hypothetical protein